MTPAARLSPEQRAEQIVREHQTFCVGHYETYEPWCSTLIPGTPLCKSCQALADKIVALLAATEPPTDWASQAESAGWWSPEVVKRQVKDFNLLCDEIRKLRSEPPTPAPFKPRYNREGAHATFNGGWQDEETRRAFHHGMDTVFNIIEKDALAPTPAPADLVRLVQEWQATRRAFKDFTGNDADLLAADMAANSADDALLAWKLAWTPAAPVDTPNALCGAELKPRGLPMIPCDLPVDHDSPHEGSDKRNRRWWFENGDYGPLPFDSTATPPPTPVDTPPRVTPIGVEDEGNGDIGIDFDRGNDNVVALTIYADGHIGWSALIGKLHGHGVGSLPTWVRDAILAEPPALAAPPQPAGEMPPIEVGDSVSWDTGNYTLCETQAWADNWNHHATRKHALFIRRAGVVIWRRDRDPQEGR